MREEYLENLVTTGKSSAIDADASSPEYQVAQRSFVEAFLDCVSEVKTLSCLISFLCSVEPASKTCKDSDGNIREEGALWEENGSGEVCTCGKGVVLCTSLQPVTDNKKTKGAEDAGVRFPGAGSKKATCIDANGNTRNDGDSWKEDCNTCG